MRRRVKLLVDVAMYGLFLYLMGYQPGGGLLPHGVCGCVLFGLFLIHHLLNLNWYRGSMRGGYTAARIVFLTLNVLLTTAMVLMAVSSVMMSGNVFAFSPVPATERGRALHALSTAWGFVLAALHVGLHTHGAQGKLHRRARDTFFGYAYVLLYLLALAAGAVCFAGSVLWRDMLLLPGGGPAVQPAVRYGQLVMITVSACQIIHLILAGCIKRTNQ